MLCSSYFLDVRVSIIFRFTIQFAWIVASFTGLPEIQNAIMDNTPLLDGVFWTPQVIGGTGFVISSYAISPHVFLYLESCCRMLYMLENQKKWYLPAISQLGWNIGCMSPHLERMKTYTDFSLEFNWLHRLHHFRSIWLFYGPLGSVSERVVDILGKLGFLNWQCFATIRVGKLSEQHGRSFNNFGQNLTFNTRFI